ncbi:uncharacterized protein LOC124668504 [Lolium rigidum]|uniref:uncharacterized protein LOC124668504 n=1 Tax=Lolium rigidum TaxID=89674 RepID=UPI001F5D7EA2|nr:uncharacterized protein LOC124668504 [Lolium rigidum]
MEEMQRSMQEWFSKALNEKFTEFSMEMNKVSAEVSDLSKQIVITQESVDEVRKKQAATPPPPAPTQPFSTAPRDPGQSGMARLTNNGQPILITPTVPASSQGFVTTPSSPTDHQEHHVKMPKHDFPKFGGNNPRLWLDLCDTYFAMYQVPIHQWVCTAVLYLEGHAALWWQAYKRRCATVDWGDFSVAVTQEFGTEEFDTQMAKLLQLRQTGTVMEYRMVFEACMYHLLSLDETLNNKFFVAQFVLGLKDELRMAVRLQAPTSVTRAVALARIQEEELEHHQPRGRPMAGNKVLPLASKPIAAQPMVQRQEWPKRAGNDEYNREQQLRDFRRANNLCYRCGEKYSKEHKCKQPLQLLTIQVGEYGEIFTEDTVQALELLEDTVVPQPECHLMFSQHAEAGSEGSTTMRFRTLVGNKVCLILVDSGSSTSFVSSEFVNRLNLATVPVQSVSVKVANEPQSHDSGLDSEVHGSAFQWPNGASPR